MTLSDRAPKLTPLSVAEVEAMRLLGVLVGLLALGAAWPALADEKFDPKQVRVITPTSATSKCIGDPNTPVCALETFLACDVRSDVSLCRQVGLNPSWKPGPNRTLKYRIVSINKIPATLEWNVIRDARWKKPYFFQISFKEQDDQAGCFDDDKCVADMKITCFRPYDKIWHIFDWEYAD